MIARSACDVGLLASGLKARGGCGARKLVDQDHFGVPEVSGCEARVLVQGCSKCKLWKLSSLRWTGVKLLHGGH